MKLHQLLHLPALPNHPKLPLTLLVMALLSAPPTEAGEGHDHGPATAAPVGQALPRFTAESEAFELVGVLSGQRITLYLDRFATNSPVRNAQIELEIGGVKFQAQATQAQPGDDTYELVLPAAPQPGVLPITATVTVGNEVDLLAGELDIHEAAHSEVAAHKHSWTEYATWAAWAAAGLATLALLAWGLRRVLTTRQLGVRGAV